MPFLPYEIEDLERFFFKREDFLASLTPSTDDYYFWNILSLQLDNENVTEKETELLEHVKDKSSRMYSAFYQRVKYREFNSDLDKFIEFFQRQFPAFTKPSFQDIEDVNEVRYPSTMTAVDLEKEVWRLVRHRHTIKPLGAFMLAKNFKVDDERYTRQVIELILQQHSALMENKVELIARHLKLSIEEEKSINLRVLDTMTLDELKELLDVHDSYKYEIALVEYIFARIYNPDHTGWDIETLESYEVGSLTAYDIGLKYAALYAKHDLNMEITMDELAAFIATGCVRDAGLAVRKQVGDRHVTEFVVQNIRFFDCLPVSSIDLTIIEHWVLRAFMKDITYPRDKDHFGDVCMDFLEKVQFRATLYIGGEYQKYQKYDHLFQSEISRETFMFLKKLNELPESEESITIPVMIKNIPELEVRVYHLYSELLAKDGITPFVAMDLSGWIPNSVDKYSYDTPAHIVHDEEFSFDLPKRCYRIVDFVSKDKSWRVLIKKGLVSVNVKPDIDGQELTVFSSVPDKVPVKVHLGTTVYGSNESNVVELPFMSSTRSQRVKLEMDGFWQFMDVQLYGEDFKVDNGIIAIAETLVPGSEGTVLIYPTLTAHGVPISTNDIISRKAVVVCQGESVFSKRYDLETPDRLVELKFNVPSDTYKVSVSVDTEYQLQRNVGTHNAQQSFNVQCVVPEKLLGLTVVGDINEFVLELRSPTGDAVSNVELDIKLNSMLLSEPHSVILSTDDNGQVHLGDLSGFVNVAVKDYGFFNVPHPRTSCIEKEIRTLDATIDVPFSAAGDAHSSVILMKASRQGKFVNAIEVEVDSVNKCVSMALEPGHYMLFMSSVTTAVKLQHIHVYAAADRFGESSFVYDRLRSTLYPVTSFSCGTVSAIERQTDGSLKVFSLYSTASTRAHVLAFPHHVPADAFDLMLSRIPKQYEREVSLSRTSKVSYTSDRMLSSTEIYVAERRNHEFRLGVNLSHPTMLLQPMNVGTASNAAAKEFDGTNFECEKEEEDCEPLRLNRRRSRKKKKMSLRKPMAAPQQFSKQEAYGGFSYSLECCDEPCRREGRGSVVNVRPLLSYLSTPNNIMLNIEIDDEGTFTIPADILKDQRNIVIVLDDYNCSFGFAHSYSIPDVPINAEIPTHPIELLGEDSLDSEKAYIDALLCDTTLEPLPFGTKNRVYKSLTDLWILFQDSFGANALKEFEWLTEDLTAEEMKEKLHTYWCDEVAFFIMLQRPDLFDTCVRPFLHHKLDRNMLENIMLYLNDREHLVSILQKYREPTYNKKLSIFERILLVALTEEDMTVYSKDTTHTGEKNKCSASHYASLFNTALNAEPLDIAEEPEPEPNEEELFDSDSDSESSEDEIQPEVSIVLPTSIPRMAFCAPAPCSMEMELDMAPPCPPGAPAPRSSARAPSVRRAKGRISKKKKVSRKRAHSKKPAAVYRPIVATKKYVETSWYNMDNNASHDVFRISLFWGEFAQHMASIPYEDRFDPLNWSFKSEHILRLIESTINFHELIFAFALFDLSSNVFCRFYRSFGEVPVTDSVDHIVIRQQIFDPTKKDPTTGLALPAGKELLINHIYTCEIICFNLSSVSQSISVLRQVPRGAVALDLKNTFSDHVTIRPFQASKVSYRFFIPRICDFYMFPATVCKLTDFLGKADVLTRSIVKTYTVVDVESWRRVSVKGSLDDVCSFLKNKYVAPSEYNYCYWRVNDSAEAFERITTIVIENGVNDTDLLKMSFKYKHAHFMRLYFKHKRPDANMLLRVFKCDGFEISHPAYRFQEFEPYVTQRVFSLGDYWQSQEVRNKYVETLELLVMSPKPDPILCVYAAYYMLLVERFTDAEKYMARVPAEHDTPFSDLIRAYLDVINGDLTVARELVKKHEDVTHLRLKPHFKEIDLLIRELDGEDVSKYQTVETFEKDDHMAHRSRQQEIGLIEETAKYLNLKAGKNCVTIDSDFEAVSLLFYPLEAEILFSNKPFDINDATRKPLISPAVTLETTEKRVPIPEEISNNSVIVEARGSGVSKRVIVHPAKFDVELRQKAGILVAKLDGAPLPRLYCKVYKNPGAGFLKDGYTDRRGAFDYFSVSTGDPKSIKRLSVFVWSPDHGHAIVEAKPPTM
ncbi:hypothetical protein PCE1_001995 [Barthelona sp. PCE]